MISHIWDTRTYVHRREHEYVQLWGTCTYVHPALGPECIRSISTSLLNRFPQNADSILGTIEVAVRIAVTRMVRQVHEPNALSCFS